ncbi:GNAT family N-acetyltransferase [Candidatus Parcubacteria bacterium]|nr:GNAT family N-acetyltransferase [Candidatus Parcubacteria bacterium]
MSDKVVFLQGKKVVLRPVNKATDMEAFQRWINDPGVRKFMTGFTPIGLQEEEEWIDGLGKRKNNITFAIETLEGELIGNIGLHGIDWVARVATTGALIGDEQNRGKGYGTDAKMILLDYAFHTLNLRKVCSEAIAYNGRSLAFNARCGYKEEGRRKDHFFKDGQYYDGVLTAVFREEWLPLWQEYNL